MSINDILTLLGGVAGLGVIGIGAFRYIIRAELAPVLTQVAGLDERLKHLEHAEPVSEDLCSARRGTYPPGVPAKG